MSAYRLGATETRDVWEVIATIDGGEVYIGRLGERGRPDSRWEPLTYEHVSLGVPRMSQHEAVALVASHWYVANRTVTPYTSPWGDEEHKAKATAGLCFRLVCIEVADHAWRNTGVPGARYCPGCIKLLNGAHPGLCVREDPPAGGRQSP